MELARYQANDIYRQLEGDLETLFKLVFTYRKPVTEADFATGVSHTSQMAC